MCEKARLFDIFDGDSGDFWTKFWILVSNVKWYWQCVIWTLALMTNTSVLDTDVVIDILLLTKINLLQSITVMIWSWNSLVVKILFAIWTDVPIEVTVELHKQSKKVQPEITAQHYHSHLL